MLNKLSSAIKENGNAVGTFLGVSTPSIVETHEALENIEEIVNIDGIDGIFIGPFDLSISMGIPGQFDVPEFRQAISRVLDTCKEAGKLCMIFTNSIEEAREYMDQGFDAVANSIDTIMFKRTYQEMMEAIRG